MKLVRIEHSRCNEWDGTEFVLAWDHWNEEFIRGQIAEAAEELLTEAKLVKEQPGNPGRRWGPVPYDQHPDKTVREVQELHAKQQDEWSQWRKENAHLERSLQERLLERGFRSLHSDKAGIIVVHQHWGHNHGLTLNYEHAPPLPEL